MPPRRAHLGISALSSSTRTLGRRWLNPTAARPFKQSGALEQRQEAPQQAQPDLRKGAQVRRLVRRSSSFNRRRRRELIKHTSALLRMNPRAAACVP